MKAEEILRNAPGNIPKDTLMRYIYIELGKIYRRDVNFFYGTDQDKNKIYNGKNHFNIEDVDIICKSIGRIYAMIFEQAGIKAKCVNKETKSPFPHIDIIASPDDGINWYYMNPMDDLYRIQGGLKTQRYGTRTTKYDGLSYYTEDQLRKMDEQIGYTYRGVYMDEFFDMVRSEFLNKAKIKEHIRRERPDLSNRDISKDFLLEYKIDFMMRFIAEFEKMQGYIELKKYQKEIFGRLLNKTERRKIKIRNICGQNGDKTKMQSVIELCLENRHFYYITQKGTNNYRKMNAEQMLDYMEKDEFHFLKEKRNLEMPEERE